MKTVIYILSLLFLFNSANASLPRLYIFHINGVNTTYDEAMANTQRLNKLNDRIHSNLISNNGNFDFLYNKIPESGICKLCQQIFDVFKQRRQEKQDITIFDYVDAYIRAYNLDIKPGDPSYWKLREEIGVKYLKEPGFVGNLPDLKRQLDAKLQLDKMKTNIVKFLDNENNVDFSNTYILFIPHSQGNLYSEELGYYLYNKGFLFNKTLGLQIAVPVSWPLGSYWRPERVPYNTENFPELPIDQYITSTNDMIIKMLRVLDVGVWKPNLQGGMGSDLLFGHSLIGTYLTDSLLREHIQRGIFYALYYVFNNDIYGIKFYFPRYFIRKSAKNTRLVSNKYGDICKGSNCKSNVTGNCSLWKDNDGYSIVLLDNEVGTKYSIYSPIVEESEYEFINITTSFRNHGIVEHLDTSCYFIKPTESECKYNLVPKIEEFHGYDNLNFHSVTFESRAINSHPELLGSVLINKNNNDN